MKTKHYIIKVSHETIPNKFIVTGIFCRNRYGATLRDYLAMMRKTNPSRKFQHEELVDRGELCSYCC